MKRIALLIATLLAGLMVAPAIQSSPLTFFQQLFGVDSADVVTQKEGPKGNGPYYGYGDPYGISTTTTAEEGSDSGQGTGPYGYGPYGGGPK